MAARAEVSTGTIVRIVATIIGCLLLVYAIYLVRSLLLLVLVAAFLAVGLDPAVRALERWKFRRGQAVAAIFLAVIAALVGFIAAVVPPLANQITDFATNLPETIQELSQSNPRIEEFVQENDISTKLEDATKKVPSLIGGSFGQVMGIAGSVLSSIFKVVTVLVLTLYFLASLSRIREGTLKLVPKSRRARVGELVDPILEKIGGYVAGNLTVSLIAGVVSFIFLTIADVPFPVALALWVAIADLIPLVGATLGAVPAVAVAFVTSLPLGIATAIFFLIYQQVENYVISPRVMKKAVDVSAAAVLVAALIGAELLGFVGALMAIPAAAALKLIAQQVLYPEAEAS